MISQYKMAFNQLKYLYYELSLIVNRKWWRWIGCWFGGSAGVITSYRLDRFFFLIFGNCYNYLRILMFPIFTLLRIISVKHDIHYNADIDRGLKILHPSLGVVISGYTIIGKNLTLTGGNSIGSRKSIKKGDLTIGDDVTVGVNAVILGPIHIGNNVTVGAGAVVIKDIDHNTIVGGVPAKILRKLPK